MINGEVLECKGEKEVAEEIAQHFEKQFTAGPPSDCDHILEGILRTISELMNRNLTRIVDDK